MAEQRLPIVDSDDGQWGTILNQYLEKEHYNTGSDNALNGGHKNITLRPGTAVAGTAPIKLTSGTSLTAPEAGAIEYDGTSLFFTPSTTRYNAIMNGLGLSGGQTFIGGTAATDVVKLQGTSGNGTLTSAAIQGLVGNNGGTVAYTALNNGNFGIGVVSPTATLHIKAGTTSAGTAPIKLSSGSLMTAPEAGAIEFLTDKLYFTQTSSTTRKTVAAYDDSSGAAGDMYYRDSGGNFVRLAIGTVAGQILNVSSGSLPAWTELKDSYRQPRVTTITSSATPTPNSDTTDLYTITAQAAGATFGAPTGTPVEGRKLMIRIKDNGVAQTLAWNAIYRAGTEIALPTTTVVSKTMYMGFIYNNTDSKWDLVAMTGNI